ncbi:MAG: PaaI family thioesterase [archaeon]|nr:MAG: PaaI family thioesterase [archaeon]
MESLQKRYSPNSVCYGCGPKNPHGLHLDSTPQGDTLVADWTPQPYHSAFADFASGGIVSVLLDCHGNWTAAHTLMKSRNLDAPPGTVTAELTVKFLRPTPLVPWHLGAWPTKIDGDKVWVEGSLEANAKQTATMTGLFVAVKEGHPAFHRWK